MIPWPCLIGCPLAMLSSVQTSAPAAGADGRAKGERPQPSGFLYKTMEFENQRYAYCVYVPPEYTAERAWPVILFLHGSGERGTDGFLPTEFGVPQAIRKNRLLIPAIVVIPQCRPEAVWWQDDMARMAVRCLEQTSYEYHLDRRRVYLTGFSLGGAGTWYIATRFPGRFAALAPICGFGDARQAAKLARHPIWCFHGSEDDKVPVDASRQMVAAIRKVGGNIKYTEFPTGGHFIWDNAYGNPEFWNWLFGQKLPAAENPAPEP